MKDKVCIIGSGNWGSAIATIIGPNVLQHSTLFEPIVPMWVFEEMVTVPLTLLSTASTTSSSSSVVAAIKRKVTNAEKCKLTEVINTFHENVKYLPNIPLPHNIVATSSIEAACCDATLLIFVLPHQFLNQRLLSQICHSKLHPTRCRAISLIKGIDFDQTTNRPKLISHIIQDAMRMKIPSFQCGVLMGANIANEVAQQQHICESTLACHFTNHHINDIKSSNSVSMDERTRLLFHNEQCFRVQHTTDIVLTEICGAIKNCIALGAGYVDGLQYGSNSKAALLRVGLYEMYQFALYFFPSTDTTNNTTGGRIKFSTMMESCGVADLITTCYSGRNRLCAETFAKERMIMLQTSSSTKKRLFDTCQQHWQDIERRLLNGQKIQGVSTIYEVYHILQAHDRTKYFPLLTAIYSITFGIEPVTTIGNGIRIIIHPTSYRSSRSQSQISSHQRSFL